MVFQNYFCHRSKNDHFLGCSLRVHFLGNPGAWSLLSFKIHVVPQHVTSMGFLLLMINWTGILSQSDMSLK